MTTTLARLFLTLWAAFTLTLTATAPAQAQSGSASRGGYQIQQARYGTPERHVDVTQRLRELARSNRSFRLTNELFGTDPDQGRVKALRIYARGADGVSRVFEYTENDVIDGSRFSGWGGGGWGRGGGSSGAGGDWQGGNRRDDGAYQILQARYGTARRNVDVTERLRDLARRDRNFRMGNDSFGVDPDEGRVKTLRIYARGPGGATRTFEYVEGSVVDGVQFSGWGGGEWGGSGGWNGGWDGRPVGGGGGGGGGYGGGSGPGRPSGQSGLNIIRATCGSGSSSADVSDMLRRQISGGRIDIQVTNDTLAVDPAPKRRKTLVVVYTTDGGRQQQVQVDEEGQLRIP